MKSLNYAIEFSFTQQIKMFLDVFIASIALVIISPIMLLISFLIILDGGAILFAHNRIGQGGSDFLCLKFRSMVVNEAEVLREHLEQNPEAMAEWLATQKLKNDPRVTKFGKFLRTTSLDELPQFFNMLKGEMSLVGARPITAKEVAYYGQDIDYYYKMRPGITGLWQVSGRNNLSYEQRVELDTWYVQNWSLWRDFVILCKTIPAVIRRDGAY